MPGGKDSVAPSGKVLTLNPVEVKVTKRAPVVAGGSSSSSSSSDGWFESIFGISSGSSPIVGGGSTSGEVSGDSNSVNSGETNSSTSSTTTTTTDLGKATEAEVTFSWTDNYTDTSAIR